MCFNTRDNPATVQDVWVETFHLYLSDLVTDLDNEDHDFVVEDLTALSELAGEHPEWVTDPLRDQLNELGYRIDDNNNVVEIGSPTDPQVTGDPEPVSPFTAVAVLASYHRPGLEYQIESDDLVLTGSKVRLVDDPEDDQLDHVYFDEDSWLEAAYEDRTYVDFDDIDYDY